MVSLKSYARRMSFDVSYYPGIPVDTDDFAEVLDRYRALYRQVDPEAFDDRAASVENLPGVEANLDSTELYRKSLSWMLSGKAEDLYRDYVFNIRPATDDRPYYTAYLKPGDIGMFLDQLGEVQ